MRVLLEYLGVFAILWVFNYFSIIKPRLKSKKGNKPTELEYLKKIMIYLLKELVIEMEY